MMWLIYYSCLSNNLDILEHKKWVIIRLQFTHLTRVNRNNKDGKIIIVLQRNIPIIQTIKMSVSVKNDCQLLSKDSNPFCKGRQIKFLQNSNSLSLVRKTENVSLKILL